MNIAKVFAPASSRHPVQFPSTLLFAALFVFLSAALLSPGCAAPESPKKAPRRYGMVIGLKPEKVAVYKELHAHPWPGVLEMIRECNIRNYSIFLKEIEPGKFYLFSYFEYVGDDFDADMAKMAADPTTQEWWKHCEPCQKPLPDRGKAQWWAGMEEVFHCD